MVGCVEEHGGLDQNTARNYPTYARCIGCQTPFFHERTPLRHGLASTTCMLTGHYRPYASKHKWCSRWKQHQQGEWCKWQIENVAPGCLARHAACHHHRHGQLVMGRPHGVRPRGHAALR